MPTTYAIPNGRTVMYPLIYTGNSTQNIVGNPFQPDLVWVKDRSSGTYQYQLHDSNRGPTAGMLNSNGTGGQDNTYQLVSFNSNGFTTASGNITGINGPTSDLFVSWCWGAGQGTNTSNTNGSITSTVSVNATAGFSIVKYTSTTGTVGHGLSAAPQFIIMKGLNVSDQWTVGHASLNGGSSPWNYGLPLNDSAATQTNSGFWNNTAPTSTVFSQGSWDSGYNKIAYCWTPIAGFSQFGSYTGNGSSDGPFIYCGFRPTWVLIKKTATGSANAYWRCLDSSRSPYNTAQALLSPSTTGAETTGENDLDILSNGFKIRDGNTYINQSGISYVYACFAENPFKYANAR